MSDFTYKFPMPAITVDLVVFDRMTDNILLIKRKKDPFKDCWALPGGFFNPTEHGEKMDNSLRDAAIRELKEETNIDVLDEKFADRTLSFLTIQDKPNRDPRYRTITVVYVLTLFHGVDKLNVKAMDDAADIGWFCRQLLVNKLIPLAFDHQDTIEKFASGRVYI